MQKAQIGLGKRCSIRLSYGTGLQLAYFFLRADAICSDSAVDSITQSSRMAARTWPGAEHEIARPWWTRRIKRARIAARTKATSRF